MDNYDNYMRPPCAQQSQNNVQYTSFSMSQTNNVNTYNMHYEYNYSTHITRNPTYSFSNCSADQLDSTTWIPDPRAVADIERGLHFSDKMETIEITSKDLSPVSCCSNIDSLIPDFYKKPNDTQTQWSSNTQKFDYPSCSQILDHGGNFMALDERTKYPHNYPFIDGEADYGYGNDLFNLDINQEAFYGGAFLDLNNLNQQQAEGSNDESDIIVEESDDEVTDCSEDNEKTYGYSTHCIICNALYTPVGSQFYILNTETPLTMSSQQPVINKLLQFVGMLYYKRNYLCCHCLNLINTIDNLQLKLEASKLELCSKYEKTCKDHNLTATSSESPKTEDYKKRKKFKHFCGLHSFKCKFCKKIFSFKKLYASHMSSHKLRNRFLCESCGCRFTRYLSFKLHLRLHVKPKPKTISAFDCKTCKKLFRTKTNLKEHENYCSGNLPYACSHGNCDKKFASSTKLKNHVKLKHEKKFVAICSICNIGFVKISDYKSHKNTHTTEKKYQCTKCEKSYKTVSNLNYHMKFHNDKLPFICTICNKGFMRKEYLESHVNNHNGVKNFACQYCDKKFVSQKNLDAHLKYHEGGVKKKACDICNKVITTGYEEHLRTHNNLKEFECNLCLMKFNTKGTLAKHRKRKHANEV
ncbi:hypothetical protein PPYR_09853 [Photinus pyralis]|uniref:C2H2-type domain-containing protein n=1 Tax=Photinus pyralis TaxID=7054 RepID=A0A1Y1MY30_PHOPY|nr:zinc finger protein 77-like [Photinus pyralis]KAB0795792.1 hypothetical protein PPYR_09853 [Photinus pyralis]